MKDVIRGGHGFLFHKVNLTELSSTDLQTQVPQPLLVELCHGGLKKSSITVRDGLRQNNLLIIKPVAECLKSTKQLNKLCFREEQGLVS